MGKKARIKRIRKEALAIDYGHARTIARALRRHRRLPVFMLRRQREEEKEDG